MIGYGAKVERAIEYRKQNYTRYVPNIHYKENNSIRHPYKINSYSDVTMRSFDIYKQVYTIHERATANNDVIEIAI